MTAPTPILVARAEDDQQQMKLPAMVSPLTGKPVATLADEPDLADAIVEAAQ